ncbi:uncharacterized protein LOC115405633 [Salarias fasciatus]|uniref:uncharacterized protein LOC115405633 n=1 Tax=Salarias fasciatus TaxID=181472 RepID=UPI001176E8A9|nr:uncharacterized protein LOC115405633 [Salarias fasciatus]
MKLLLWSSLLVLWVLQTGTEENTSNICLETSEQSGIHVETATEEDYVDENDVSETFVCLLHPSDELNCSWSFHTLQRDDQLSVQIRVCNGSEEVQSLKEESVKRDGWASLDIPDPEDNFVVLQFNMTLHGEWKAYTYKYDKDKLDLLSPPSNISVSVENDTLFITWGLPSSRGTYHARCFEYQLNMGDQFEWQNEDEPIIDGQQSYKKSNADPAHAHRLRMRARVSDSCSGCSEWSDWSHDVVVKQPLHTFNLVAVVLLSLGMHLVLLAVLLFLRRRRVCDVLFPPIPRPPLKYKYFLEKSDAFQFFDLAVPARPEEEVTEVEYMVKKPPNVI